MIKSRLESFLEKGYTKSQLARELEISRSTLINLLEDPKYKPSKAILTRINLHLDWIEKSQGHELIESLTFVYLQNQDVIKNFTKIIERSEQATGYEVGYHAITFGGPVGFLMITSPGISPMSDIVGSTPIESSNFGRTESLLIGEQLRYSANHSDATDFFKKHANTKIYLKLFSNYNFTPYDDLKKVQKLILDDKHKESIFLMESGLLAGRYDYFTLIAAKNEEAYIDLLTEKNSIYSVTQKSLTDSITISVVAPEMHYRSKHLSKMLQNRS